MDDFESGDMRYWLESKHEPRVEYTGHERDANGLTDYMLARTYLYPLFRFGSVDPARDGWNLYAYVGNNPLRATDPTGLRLTIVVDNQSVQLSDQQLMTVALGIRERFSNAGVKNVRLHFASDSVFLPDNTPSKTKAHDVVRLTLVDSRLDDKKIVYGKADIGQNTTTVSTAHAPEDPEERSRFLINIGAHEVGHGTKALPYDGDAYPPGTILNPVPAEEGFIMEQGLSPSEWGSRVRDFSEKDAALLRNHLNDL